MPEHLPALQAVDGVDTPHRSPSSAVGDWSFEGPVVWKLLSCSCTSDTPSKQPMDVAVVVLLLNQQLEWDRAGGFIVRAAWSPWPVLWAQPCHWRAIFSVSVSARLINRAGAMESLKVLLAYGGSAERKLIERGALVQCRLH